MKRPIRIALAIAAAGALTMACANEKPEPRPDRLSLADSATDIMPANDPPTTPPQPTNVPPATRWWPAPDVPLVHCRGDGPSAAFLLETAALEDDTLLLAIAFNGGCAEHGYRTCWDGTFVEPEPIHVVFTLEHDAGGDECESWLTETLRVPLAWLREAWTETYGPDAGALTIAIEDWRLSFGTCTRDRGDCPP